MSRLFYTDADNAKIIIIISMIIMVSFFVTPFIQVYFHKLLIYTCIRAYFVHR